MRTIVKGVAMLFGLLGMAAGVIAENNPNAPIQGLASTAGTPRSGRLAKERILGVCAPSPNHDYSLGNTIEPITEAQGYFHRYEHRDVTGTISVTVLQQPNHGVLRLVSEADRGTLFDSSAGPLEPDPRLYAYLPEQGYEGDDTATILVDFGGKNQVKVKYYFQAISGGLGNDWVTEYCSKTGYSWQISSAPPEDIPPPIVVADDPASLAGRQITERAISRIFPGRYSNYTSASPFLVSPDGLRVAYIFGFDAESEQEYGGIGDDGWKKHSLMLDGRKVKYDNVSAFQFSLDSKHVAYRVDAPNDNQGGVVSFFVVDGREGERYIVGAGPIRYLIGPQFSPDGNHVAYFTSSAAAVGPSYVVTDGKREKVYAGISWFTYSPDSKHFAYVANDSDNKYLAVIDGQEGKRYSRVHGIYVKDIGQPPLFSPDSKHVAYFAERYIRTVPTITSKSFVVIDGQEEGTQFNGISQDYLIFSPDSQHLLYVAATNEGTALVVDGKAGKGYPMWVGVGRVIENPVFSPDSKHVAYIVRGNPNGGETFVVVDGQEGKHYSAKDTSIANLNFTADGKAFYVLFTADSWIKVSNGIETARFPRYGTYTVTFSPDGKHFAYVGSRVKGKRFFVVDGKEGKPYDLVLDPIFSPDGKSFAYAAYTETYTEKGKKWRVVVNGREGKAYDMVLAGGANDPSSTVDTSSLHFDAPDKFHYLAVSGQNIILVEEQLKVSPEK